MNSIINGSALTVLHSVPHWLPQTQTWISNQIRHLSPWVESHVVCDSVMNLDQFPMPNLHALDAGPRWRYHRERGLRKARGRHHPGYLFRVADIVGARVLHSHFGHIAWRALGAARKAKLRHVVTFYGFDASWLPQRRPWWRVRYRTLFEQVDIILCEGPHMAGRIGQLGCPPDKVRVHHLGVEVNSIEFQPRRWEGSDPLRVLIAASFREKKGIPYAIAALGHLNKIGTRVEITIIGDATPELRSKLEKRRILEAIVRNGLQNRVRLLGHQPFSVLMSEAYHHHVFLSPSVTARDGDTEGGAPVAIIEMAATGMPIVSTRHCDIPGVLPSGTGLLAEERDVEGLAQHLRWLVERPEAWRDMVVSARKHIETEYDVRRQGERLAQTYRELTN